MNANREFEIQFVRQIRDVATNRCTAPADGRALELEGGEELPTRLRSPAPGEKRRFLMRTRRRKNSCFVYALLSCLFQGVTIAAAQAPPVPPASQPLDGEQKAALCDAIDSLCNTLWKKRLTAKKNAVPPEITIADLGSAKGDPFMITCADGPGGSWTKGTSNEIKINIHNWDQGTGTFSPYRRGGPTDKASLDIFTGAALAHELAHTRQRFNGVVDPIKGFTGATPDDTKRIAAGEAFGACIELGIISAHLGSTFYGIARSAGLTIYIQFFIDLRNKT